MYRHGDVLLVQAQGPLPEPAGEKRTVILAEGEFSGHAHRVTGEDVKFDGQVLTCPAPAVLDHEEHGQICLLGLYSVTPQREYKPAMEPVRVRD